MAYPINDIGEANRIINDMTHQIIENSAEEARLLQRIRSLESQCDHLSKELRRTDDFRFDIVNSKNKEIDMLKKYIDTVTASKKMTKEQKDELHKGAVEYSSYLHPSDIRMLHFHNIRNNMVHELYRPQQPYYSERQCRYVPPHKRPGEINSIYGTRLQIYLGYA